MELLGIDKVGGDEPAVEQHGKNNVKIQNWASGQVLARQRIGEQQGHHQAQKRTDKRHKRRCQIGAAYNGRVCPQIPVGIQAEFGGKQRIAVLGNGLLAGNRRDKHQRERNDREYRHHGQHRIADYGSRFQALFLFHSHFRTGSLPVFCVLQASWT